MKAVHEVFESSWSSGVDFGFQGPFEKRFTDAFVAYQGGGYVDAVASGTAAIFVALCAADPPRGSHVLLSPVTNPGDAAPIALLGLKAVVADSAPGSLNVDPTSFERALTPETRVALLTHAAGFPIHGLRRIAEIAREREIVLIEDFSQAQGSRLDGTPIGTFGDIAVASTMFSKTLASGGSGGLVYTQNEDLYWRMRGHADRGKPFRDPEMDPKEAGKFEFPALNLNSDELSCAIGAVSLGRLDDAVARRFAVYERLCEGIGKIDGLDVFVPDTDAYPSVFYCPVRFDPAAFSVDKAAFTSALAAEGIWLNPHYKEVVAEWPWLTPYLARPAATPNAVAFRDNSFNLLYHERFGPAEAEDIVAALAKVARAYAR